MFKAPHSTEVVVEAVNRYGSAKAELGLVIIFDLPEVAVVIPGVSTPSVTGAGAQLAKMATPIARAEFRGPVVPALPQPDLETPWRAIFAAAEVDRPDQADQAVAWSATEVGRQVTESADELRELLGEALESALREKLPDALRGADR